MNKQMIKQIESAKDNESLIETVYRNELRNSLGGEWSKPHQCDGLLTLDNGYTILIEAKADYTLKYRENIASVLQQVLFYLYRFQTKPDLVLLVENNTFVLFPVNMFLPMLMYTDIKWNEAPSDHFKKEGKLYNELIPLIKKNLYFVFELDQDPFTDLVDMIKDYQNGFDNKKYIFNYWLEKVLGVSMKNMEGLDFLLDKAEDFKKFLRGEILRSPKEEMSLFNISRKCDFAYFSKNKVMTYPPYNFDLFDKYISGVDMSDLELKEMYKWWLKKVFKSDENKSEYRVLFRKVVLGEDIVLSNHNKMDGIEIDMKAYHEFFMWYFKYTRPNYKQKLLRQVQVGQQEHLQ